MPKRQTPPAPTEQGPLSHPHGQQNLTETIEQGGIGVISVDRLGQGKQSIRLLTQAFQPFPISELG